ncbi:DHA2 family efflux MFS transporter permease subunit [Bordetella sp. FB-8]|uniref:DHA2 family efflux MFS transporter permease subunit n=1 Tax=Bordetella sp. FB-8 TaxID=1159870 RepID=UPI000373E663|nr:DHA2 family efflux MFS transporter permease subunit [Bordetella sp. FB-8]
MGDVRVRSRASFASEGRDAQAWKITVVAMFGALLAQLDATIVNVSLSSLAADLHAPLSTIQWVTSGYLLALAFALPLNGWLIERVGAKALYLWCFSIFTISSALCGLAWSASSLIGFRLVQGASGGLLAPMAQMMIKRATGPHFTRVAGYAALPVLLGPLLGPVIAGAILHYTTWRGLFLVNIPFGVLAFVLAVRFLPDDEQDYVSRKLDWMGLFLLSPGLMLILFGAGNFTRPAGLAATAAGAFSLAAFLYVEKSKGAEALIDLGLLRRRAFSAAALTQFFCNGVLFAGQMLIPLFLVQACGQSPAAMGWMLAPMGLGMMVAMPSLGFLTGRFGDSRVAKAGALFSLVSTLALVGQAAQGLDQAVMAGILFVRGLGLGAVGLPAISLAYASVEKNALPMATTTLNIVQRVGGPILTTFCALFLSWALQEHVSRFGLNAWAWAFLALAALHLIMAFATMTLPLARQA